MGLIVKKDKFFFYLNREFYELNLSAFNSIFGLSPSMDLPYQNVPKEFNQMRFGMKNVR